MRRKKRESAETFLVSVFFGDLVHATYAFCNLSSKMIRMWKSPVEDLDSVNFKSFDKDLSNKH